MIYLRERGDPRRRGGSAGKHDRGILICGTGIGVSLAANKVKGAYAACIHDVYQAQRAQLSNHANIITMGSQVIGIELANSLLKNIFL